MYSLFFINFKVSDIKHVVYMTINEFLSKKRQLPWKSKSRGGGGGCPDLKHLYTCTCIYRSDARIYFVFCSLLLGNGVSGPVCGKKFGDQTFIGK